MYNKNEIRENASHFLGRELTDYEWECAFPLAERKLDRIIAREGDSDGERRKPYYLGKLVQECITVEAFSNYAKIRNAQIMMERSVTHEADTTCA